MSQSDTLSNIVEKLGDNLLTSSSECGDNLQKCVYEADK